MIMDKMIFGSMLFGFGVALKTGFRITSLKDSGFKRGLYNKSFMMQVKIRDKNTGRFYKLEKGKIISEGKVGYGRPDVLLEWQDSKTAIQLITKGIQMVINKDPKLFIASAKNTISEGKLAVEVEFEPTYSFLESVVEMMMSYSGFLEALRKIPYVDPMLKRIPYVKEAF